MTNEQILKKAIEKAVRGGWKELDTFNEVSESIKLKATKWYFPNYYQLIFSHDFAKAFWGEEKVCCEVKGLCHKRLCWLYGMAKTPTTNGFRRRTEP